MARSGTMEPMAIPIWLRAVLVGFVVGISVEASAPAHAASDSQASPGETLTEGPGQASAGRPAVALQAGWWSAEAEWRTHLGLYGAVGVPWVMVPLSLMGGASWALPVGGRLGFDLPLSPRWSVRASGHAATMVSNEQSKCGCVDEGPTWRTFLFAEVGVRHQRPSGVVFGADLPLFGMRTPNHRFPPPVSLAFTQAYIGYSWGR
jgi:hypothetical protein